MIRCITSDGGILACAVDSSAIVAAGQQIHGASAVAAAALGRLLRAAPLMGALLKEDGASLTLKVAGGGPLGTLVAIGDSRGNCRGYVERPEVELPPRADGKLDVGGAVGRDGRLGVIRDYGTGEPYSGQVELATGEIAEDITRYYAVSEQIPTVCALGVLVGKEDHRALLAGGLLVQALPGASSAGIDRLERNIATLEPVTTLLAKGFTPEDICRRALDGFEVEILDARRVSYRCTCSEERVLRALATLRPQELHSMAEETGYAEAKCRYCGKTYRIPKEKLEALAAAQKA